MAEEGRDRSVRRRSLLRAAAGLLALGPATHPATAHDETYPEHEIGSGSNGTDRSVEDLVDALTLAEKIRLVHGHNPENDDGTGADLAPVRPPADGEDLPVDRPATQDRINTLVAPVDRLCIPGMNMTDGPAGVARDQHATAFPVPILTASTWDPELQAAFGRRLGSEAKATNHGALLAPGFNIARISVCGRNFEYYGEDPHLAARTAVNVVEGIQSADVVATLKHFVANNQETDRFVTNANVSERALREIYLPAFRAAVQEAEAGAVMSAYNRLDDVYCSANEWLLTDLLKDEWGFDGYVVSDFEATGWAGGRAVGQEGATRPEAAAKMATAGLDFEAAAERYFGSDLRTAVEDGLVPERRLDDMVRRILGQMRRFDILQGDHDGGAVNSEEHQQFARHLATQGGVLLQNRGLLPLGLDSVDSIAVVGHEADRAKVGGGGSSSVTPPYTVSPLEGIRTRAGGDAEILYAPGYAVGDAAAVAAAADVAVAFVNGESMEFADREDLRLDAGQNQLVESVAAANPRTVVVSNTGGPVLMPWLDDVPSVLQMWYPGMEDGNATADLLFGDVPPAGRLPITFARERDHYPAEISPAQYPGFGLTADYTEGVFVGYRHFDRAEITPLFPFGHGLTYTEFEYRDLNVPRRVPRGSSVPVRITVENVGERAGKEVVQVYVADQDPPVPRPPKELRAFETIHLRPGETRTVTVTLDDDAFSYFDEDLGGWVVPPGPYTVAAGRSAGDLRGQTTVMVTDT
jgi:beta-glucosidase